MDYELLKLVGVSTSTTLSVKIRNYLSGLVLDYELLKQTLRSAAFRPR